ncbi:MAG: SAP domain-containing protein [Proteobacteria bacterium]|nr:SAP domain-containing protein [Cystobacterineae bacterium]MCL2258880.1 SAP domain-containing protein [Cystobacterineae bacterium]MCL2314655.1 SAP domain-containing protein [Pseudomonadota bacterium]
MGLFDFLRKKQKKPSQQAQQPPQAPPLRGQTPPPQAPRVMSAPSVSASTPEIISIPRQPTQFGFGSSVVGVEARIKTAMPSKQGLYPHEILVLSYAHKFYTCGNSFQGFWWYKYGVRDVQSVLTSLMNRGFLKIGDVKAALKSQTATAIEEVLRAHGCKVSGKKAELVQRALDEIPEDELNKRFPKRLYQLTKEGKQELEEEAYVPYIHRFNTLDLDIWSFNQLMHTQPTKPFREKLWEYLTERSAYHLSRGNFGHYRNLATTAPGVVDAIMDCQEKLGYSDNELKTALRERMAQLSTPLQLFEVDECVQIVFMERDEDKKGLTKLYAKAKETFKQKYPGIKV